MTTQRHRPELILLWTLLAFQIFHWGCSNDECDTLDDCDGGALCAAGKCVQPSTSTNNSSHRPENTGHTVSSPPSPKDTDSEKSTSDTEPALIKTDTDTSWGISINTLNADTEFDVAVGCVTRLGNLIACHPTHKPDNQSCDIINAEGCRPLLFPHGCIFVEDNGVEVSLTTICYSSINEIDDEDLLLACTLSGGEWLPCPY
ncbi:MAG: hypothetical protein JXR76_27205 [Deltaproteobacteria bacterium]|nr:hypothetical protein [Deltaproteobacteria bacterium]